MYKLNLDVPALIFSAVCLLYLLATRRKQYLPPRGWKNKLLNQHVVFLTLLAGHTLSAASSLAAVILETAADPGLRFWIYLADECYFFFHSVLAFALAQYILNVTGVNRKWNRSRDLLFLLPFLVSELLVLTNPLTGLVFSISENATYVRGFLLPLQYVIGGLYFVIAVVTFFKSKKAISRTDSKALLFMIGLAGAGIVIQAVWPSLLVELFAEAIAIWGLVLMLEERRGSINGLTGALNRKAFADTVMQKDQPGHDFSVIIIRLTNIPSLSRILPVREVDRLIIQVADFLSTIASPQNIYCYYYSSFALVADNKTDRDNSEKLEVIRQRFLNNWEGISGSYALDVSLCALRYGIDFQSFSELEPFLYDDYGRPDGKVWVVDRETIQEVQSTFVIERELRKAVEKKDFCLHYQPIWSVKEDRTVAAEALLRVTAGPLAALSPEKYIPVAEKTGLIRDIGLFVFEEACRFIRDRDLFSMGIRYIEVNLSISQFLYGDPIQDFERIRSAYGVPADKLNLEITETSSMQEEPVVMEAVARMQELGYRFSLDDFGTGYSNFVRVFQIPFMNIKVDRSVLWDSFKSRESYIFLKTIHTVAGEMGFQTLQEGVETEEQLAVVNGFGCDLIQGFYYSRALPEEQFMAFIAGKKDKTEDASDESAGKKG